MRILFNISFLCAVLLAPKPIESVIKKSYQDLIQEILVQKQDYYEIYKSASSSKEDSLTNIIGDYLEETITKRIFPFWYGTPWDFNGYTTIPGEGKFACGYFVTNTLSDLGFNIPRIGWAQAASEIMIVRLCGKTLKRFSNTPLADIKSWLKENGDGLYLACLDCDVGYIYVSHGDFYFVHSDYYIPWKGVKMENMTGNNPFANSKYRILGKLFAKEMIINWVMDEPYSL